MTITRAAPLSRAITVAARPCGPTPWMTTVSPADTSPWRRSHWIPLAKMLATTATFAGIDSGTRETTDPGARYMYSASAPHRLGGSVVGICRP